MALDIRPWVAVSRGSRAEVDMTPPYQKQGSLPARLRSQELQLVFPTALDQFRVPKSVVLPNRNAYRFVRVFRFRPAGDAAQDQRPGAPGGDATEIAGWQAIRAHRSQAFSAAIRGAVQPDEQSYASHTIGAPPSFC